VTTLAEHGQNVVRVARLTRADAVALLHVHMHAARQ